MEYEHAFPMYPIDKESHPAEIKRQISAKFFGFLAALAIFECVYLHANSSMQSSV